MLSKKSKYAIKALACLAKRYTDNTPLKIADISIEEKIPRKFLEAILVELKNHGLLISRLGTSGGYMLAKHPNEIYLSQVIRLSGGAIALLPCISLNFYEACEECPDEKICGLRNIMFEVREATIQILSKTSIADMIKKESALIKKFNL
jgi:Rrf2 family protein